jgi:O-antigen ligase
MVASFATSFLTTKYTTSIVSAPNYMHEENVVIEEDLTSKVTYLESVIHGQFLEGSSMDGRFEMWEHLWEMIKEKPLLGHAPYKEYFYENHIYSESEYVMMTWRYGFIGLLIYISIYLFLALIALRNLHLHSAKVLLFTVILMMVTAITNNPFSHQKILIFIAFIVGSFFWELNKSTKTDSIR